MSQEAVDAVPCLTCIVTSPHLEDCAKVGCNVEKVCNQYAEDTVTALRSTLVLESSQVELQSHKSVAITSDY